MRRPLALALLLAVTPATSALAEGPALLLHGNYCGPGNNGPRPPVDALDAACARHDACTPDGGLASRACNARLVREAGLVASDPTQPEDLRALAGLVAAGAGLIPAAPEGTYATHPADADETGLLRHPELLADAPIAPRDARSEAFPDDQW